MSQAFMREPDNQWLHEISPTLNALSAFLSRENGITVYLKKSSYSEKLGKEVHEMSHGLSYALNDKGQWYMLD